MSTLQKPAVNKEREAIESMLQLARFAAQRGWVPATSGNFSCRTDANRAVLTRSGADKNALCEADAIVVHLEGPLPAGVSAEAPLHVARYRADGTIGAIAHVHTVASTVLSRLAVGQGSLPIGGYEMQKAFEGITTHRGELRLPVFANDQDTPALAERIEETLGDEPLPGYLLEGHGLYAWGSDAAQTVRHLEGLEFLLQCVLEERRLQA